MQTKKLGKKEQELLDFIVASAVIGKLALSIGKFNGKESIFIGVVNENKGEYTFTPIGLLLDDSDKVEPLNSSKETIM